MAKKPAKSVVDMSRDVYTARLAAREKFPYLSTALFAMVTVITDQVPTTGIDRWWRLYVNPTFFAECDLEAGAACMVHEVWHLLSRHCLRADALCITQEQAMLANICQDLEINQKDDLHISLAKTPVQPCMPDMFEVPEGLIFEEYWELLKDKIKIVKVNVLMPGSGNCGSGAHGKPGDNPWELPAPDGSKDATAGVSTSRGTIIINEVAKKIVEAAKSRGDVPAGWLRWANEIVSPVVDWRAELPVSIRGAISPATGKDYPTFQRMSRRQHPIIIRPGRLAAVPVVSVIVDTSGSMSDGMISQGLAEVDGVILATGVQADVSVYFTDCAAAEVQKVRSARQLRPIGGGGTDMNKGWDAILADIAAGIAETPDLIICVTDGYTPWPAEPPLDCKHVILVLTADGSVPGWASEEDDQCKVIRCVHQEKEAEASV